MADRPSDRENNSVQDFVRSVLHAVTNLQTQSANSGGTGEESGNSEFTSVESEVNARFQIPRGVRGRRGSASFSTATSTTRVVPSVAYNPRQNYSPVQRQVGRWPGGGRRNGHPSRPRAESQPDFVYKDICLLPDPDWSQVPRGATKGDLVRRGLYIDAFKLDKNWSEARLYSELASLFKEALEQPNRDDIW